MPNIRSWIYDTAISFTNTCYQKVLENIPPNSRVLDVGIGTGTTLTKNKELILSKNLQLYGIDIDERYIAACQKRLHALGLTDQVCVERQDAYEFEPQKRFDHIILSDSFPLFPDKITLLKRMRERVLVQGGTIHSYMDIQQKKRAFQEFLKPRLKYLTTIEFGTVTYAHVLEDMIDQAGLEIQSQECLHRWDIGFIGTSIYYLRLQAKAA